MRNEDTYSIAHADVDIQYGGLFIRLVNDYAEVVEVTDLDSAAGATNLVLVEAGSVYLAASTFRAESLRNVWRQVMTDCGPLGDDRFRITGIDRPTLRRMVYAAAWDYGLAKDVDSSVVIATTNRCRNCGDPIERVMSGGKSIGWTHSEIERDGMTYQVQDGCDYGHDVDEVATPDFGDADGSTWTDMMPEDGTGIVDGADGLWSYLEAQFDITRPSDLV
jgi:hypothetical protein